MKTTLWLTTFSLFAASPMVFAKTEVESLRSTVAEQERQIRQLEDENMKLRSLNGQTVKAPAEAAPISKTPVTAPAPATGRSTYTVRSGDTLAKIARKNGTSAESLAKLNKIKDPTRLSIGQKIQIPGKASASVASTAAAPAPEKSASAPAGSDTYIVRDGDTFYSIARKNKVSADSLVAANPGIKASELRTGQLIRLSSKSAPAQIASEKSAPKAPSETVANHPAPLKSPEPNIAESKATPPPATPSPAASATPAHRTDTAAKTPVHSVTIDGEMTYGEFAAKHGTQIERLNELNGLDLTQNTVLAKGSELYVSAQP